MQLVNCSTLKFFSCASSPGIAKFQSSPHHFYSQKPARHPKVISKLTELELDNFQEVIDDDYVDINEVRRVVFCSGKIYYDLLEKKLDYNARDVALVRIKKCIRSHMIK